MISASTVRPNAYFSFAGLLNVLSMRLSGLRRKVFAQLGGPTIIMFLCFPLPFTNKFRKLFAKSITQTLFCDNYFAIALGWHILTTCHCNVGCISPLYNYKLLPGKALGHFEVSQGQPPFPDVVN